MQRKFGNRHWNFYVAVAVGVVVAGITLMVAMDLFPAVAASAFSLTYLVLTARDMPRLTPDYLREHAGGEDAPPWIVFLLTVGVVVYVTGALFLLLNEQSANPLRLGLGIVSVILTWLMIQVMWGMHYACEFYQAPDKDKPKTKSRAPQTGGLVFPGTDEPCGADFVYFTLVVAMTAQTSDVEIESSAMRRIVTVQSLISYLFNTVMLAAAVKHVVSRGK